MSTSFTSTSYSTTPVSLPDDDLCYDKKTNQSRSISADRQHKQAPKDAAVLPAIALQPRAITTPTPTQEDEKEEKSIRPRIAHQIQQVLRGYRRQEYEKGVMSKGEDPSYRCTLCTLPVNTCKHNPEWLEAAFQSRLEDPVEREMKKLVDEVDVISENTVYPSLKATLSGSAKEKEGNAMGWGVRQLQWVEPMVLPNDRINSDIVDISSPFPRGGHSCIILGVNTTKLMVFGGLTTANLNSNKEDANTSVFHPYASHRSSERDYGTVTNEVYFYSFMDFTWQQAPVNKGVKPPPRMDHVAIALDRNRVWVFGGRDDQGQCFNDVWIFHDNDYRWERVDDILPCPTPRYLSSAAMMTQTGEVVVFGGRDAAEVLGDLWVWNPLYQTWSSALTVGIPPTPRYGHSVVAVSSTRVLVVGGASQLVVAAQEKMERYKELFENEFKLRKAADKLESCCVEEGEQAELMGSWLKENASTMGWRELSRAAAKATATIASTEALTNQAERELIAIEHENNIKDLWQKKERTDKVPENLEITILELEEDGRSYRWIEPSTPPISGIIPSTRTRFVVNYMPKLNRLLLWGGLVPGTNDMMDEHVYVLNLKTMHWSRPAVEDTKEVLELPLKMTQMSLQRAKRNLEAARNRAFSHGIPGGRSIEVAQAKATLTVYEWHLERIKEEQKLYLPKPEPRFGLQGVVYGGRIFLYGGWDENKAVADLIALDLEQPDERERRFQDELAIRLERERARKELEQLKEIKRLWFAELCRKKEEEMREAKEREIMAWEDHLSSFPQKTRGPKPKIKWANGQSAAVEWEAVHIDAKGLRVPPESVEYILWMKGGYTHFYVGRSILVEVYRTTKQKQKKYKIPKILGNMVVSYYDLAYAKIKKDHHNGTFDVIFDKDNSEECYVIRNRLRPAQEPQWEAVYQGRDCQAEIIDLIPDYIREREPEYTCITAFAVQTIGIDYPKREASLFSEDTITVLKREKMGQKLLIKHKTRTVRQVDTMVLHSWNDQHWAEGVGRRYT